MSEMKATPGPWKLGRDRSILAGSAQQFVAQIIRTNGDHEEAVANAHLIASAPDLYAVLERVTRIFGDDKACWDEARDALARARGDVR